MWLFRTLLNFGIWCFFWLALWALLFVFGISSAFASTTCYQWYYAVAGVQSGFYNDPADAAIAQVAACNAQASSSACVSACTAHTFVYVGVTTSGFPTYTDNMTCTESGTAGHAVTISISTNANATCPVCPQAGQQTFYGLDTLTQSGLSCHNGCQYTPPTTPYVVKCSASSGTCTNGTGVVESTSTGQACGSSVSSVSPASPDDPTNENPIQCDATGTICETQLGGNNCGTYNGDEVCVGTIAPSTCVQYSSGGVACAASASGTFASPPVPGSGGTPATPNMQVTSNNTTVNYYSSATVASATTAPTTSNPVQPLPTGTQGVGSSGGTSGTVAVSSVGGTVSVAGTVGVTPNASNGDCGASGVNCTGSSAPTTGFSGDCTDFASCTENFYTSVTSAPIVQGAVAIESSWPAGSCDIGSVTMVTFDNRSFNYGTQACQVWNDYMATPLSAILLVVYAVAGVFIILSA